MITEQDVLCAVERRSRIYCPCKRQARQDIYVRWVEVKYGGKEAWTDDSYLQWLSEKVDSVQRNVDEESQGKAAAVVSLMSCSHQMPSGWKGTDSFLTCFQFIATPERKQSAITRTHIKGQIWNFGQWEEGRVPGENPGLLTERDPGP